MPARISASIFILLCVLFAPFWVYAVLIVAAMAYFRFYWEGVALFFLSDLLYGAPEAKFHGFVFVDLVAGMIIFTALELLKKKLRYGV